MRDGKCSDNYLNLTVEGEGEGEEGQGELHHRVDR